MTPELLLRRLPPAPSERLAERAARPAEVAAALGIVLPSAEVAPHDAVTAEEGEDCREPLDGVERRPRLSRALGGPVRRAAASAPLTRGASSGDRTADALERRALLTLLAGYPAVARRLASLPLPPATGVADDERVLLSALAGGRAGLVRAADAARDAGALRTAAVLDALAADFAPLEKRADAIDMLLRRALMPADAQVALDAERVALRAFAAGAAAIDDALAAAGTAPALVQTCLRAVTDGLAGVRAQLHGAEVEGDAPLEVKTLQSLEKSLAALERRAASLV